MEDSLIGWKFKFLIKYDVHLEARTVSVWSIQRENLKQKN